MKGTVRNETPRGITFFIGRDSKHSGERAGDMVEERPLLTTYSQSHLRVTLFNNRAYRIAGCSSGRVTGTGSSR